MEDWGWDTERIDAQLDDWEEKDPYCMEKWFGLAGKLVEWGRQPSEFVERERQPSRPVRWRRQPSRPGVRSRFEQFGNTKRMLGKDGTEFHLTEEGEATIAGLPRRAIWILYKINSQENQIIAYGIDCAKDKSLLKQPPEP